MPENGAERGEKRGARFRQALAAERAGAPEKAAGLYRRCVELDELHAPSLARLGMLAFAAAEPAEAADWLARAAAAQPGDAALLFNLGLACKAANRPEEAIAAYRRSIALDAAFPPAHGALGVALAAQGNLDEAVSAFECAARLDPRLVLAWTNLAVTLKDLDRLDEALAASRQALEIDPANAGALNTQGDVLRRMGRFEAAAAAFEQAAALDPGWAHPLYNLAGLMRDQGRTGEAVALYEHVAALAPDLAEARWALCMAELQPLYDDEAQVEQRREAYRSRLAGLEAAYPGRRAEALGAGVGASQPFHLAYQGRDDRKLQAQYGRLVRRALPPVSFVLPMRPRTGEPIRVGVVSGYFHHHANWRAPIKGWLEQLDRARFRLFGYHTGAVRDAQTDVAARLCERFVQGPLPEARWIKTIIEHAPHVLIFPEIGMDPMALRLAARRLARAQCASWGHPSTTGLPTIDYFLSSALMEPDEGQDHYTEKLVRLPNLSIYYEPPAIEPEPMSRATLGLPDEQPLFWCGQSLSKFQPGLDPVFARIAKAVGPCQFLFLEYPGAPELTERFRARLGRAFAASGLAAADHCRVLPRLSPQQFLGVAGLCDVTLDSLGWSGCNTLLEGLAHDTPIVTMAGSLMRARHGAAILNRMGLQDLVADSVEGYERLAARLAVDKPFNAEARRRIAGGKARLYRDSDCIRALERFLEATAFG